MICIAVLGQGQSADAGLSPYMLRLTTEEEPVYVLVDQATLRDEDVVKIPVILDEPWRGPPEERREYIQRQWIIESASQESAPRRARLQRGWKAAGGIQISTPSGRRWVLEEEYEWAQKASALADAAFTEEVPGETAENARPSSQERATAGPPFWRIWGPHIAIAAGALALCALIVGLAVRSRS